MNMNMGGNAFNADEALTDVPTEEQATEAPVEETPTEEAKEEV